MNCTLDEAQIEVTSIIESPPESDNENWTQNIQTVSLGKISHSDIERYFVKSGDKKHQEQGYMFSKSQKFETSGRPMQVMIVKEKYLLLEGYTRPAMKSSKGINQGRGLYRCIIVYSLENGKILQAREYNCPAGKRGYCKHIAALAYKFVDCALEKKSTLPKPLTCTNIKQQWGLPALKAEQDPEKERLKRKPLQDITFKRQQIARDLSGGCKRKLPNQISSNFSSKPAREPPIDTENFLKLGADLQNSSSPSILSMILKKQVDHDEKDEIQDPVLEVKQKQGSSEWFAARVGKITSSKISSLVGLNGRKELESAWYCVKEKIQEPSKHLANFERGKLFEPVAANAFQRSSGLLLVESPFVLHPKNPSRYGASPDRTFDTVSYPMHDIQGNVIELKVKFIIEIKTRAIGSSAPLQQINGCHILQCQFQMCCMPCVKGAILLSFLPESSNFSMFYIERDEVFIQAVMAVCDSVVASEHVSFDIAKEHGSVGRLASMDGVVPNFESILPIRSWANDLAKHTKRVFLPEQIKERTNLLFSCMP